MPDGARRALDQALQGSDVMGIPVGRPIVLPFAASCPAPPTSTPLPKIG